MMISYLNKLVIMLTTVIGSFFSSSCNNLNQENRIQELSKKYCTNLNQINSGSESKEEVLSRMMSAAHDLGENNKVLTLAIKQEIADRIKSTYDKDINYAFATDFVLELLESCPTYSKLVREQLPEANKKNRTIVYMSDRIRGFINEWDNMKFLDLYNRATDSIVFNYSYAPHAREDYGVIDWDYFEPYNDIHIELLHTSDPYLKGYLISEQLRAMGADVKNFPKEVPMKWNID